MAPKPAVYIIVHDTWRKKTTIFWKQQSQVLERASGDSPPRSEQLKESPVAKARNSGCEMIVEVEVENVIMSEVDA